MPPRRVAIVPHTHWDREWYAPYQTFRMDLVDMLDGLLDLLDADPAYTKFMLDGQLALVDDYLEIRPHEDARLRRLSSGGRLSMGPWYVLMDEFLVSGETIIRDLQMGIERGAAFGGVMEVGYLPDMFGHIAQMPQILRQAGFRDAVLWRGVPSQITKTGFLWEGPDGSTVRAEYLPVGYGNGAALPADAKAFIRRVEDHIEEVSSFAIDELLMMNGSDHQRPQPWLGQVVAEANAIQEELRFEICSLPDYLARAPREGLEHWKGELRSGARSNLLMGVASNRVDVKRSAAIAERNLERRAEPLAALFLEHDAYPTTLLDLAWREMIRNSAHDSVCACSVDEVVDAVLQRYAEARQIAQGVAGRALSSFARSMKDPGPVLVNASSQARQGVVELVVTGEELDLDRLQVISERTNLPGTLVLDATTVKTVLGMLQGPRVDDDAWVHGVEIEDLDDGLHLTISIGPDERSDVPIAEIKQELYTRLGARPDAMVHVALKQPRITRVLARSSEVPGFGWCSFSPSPLVHPASASELDGAVTLRNSLITVEIDATDGSFAINGLSGFGRLVDVGDLGDSYNYSPPANDSVIDSPEEVSVHLIESGPVRASAEICTRYAWPEYVDGSSQRRMGCRQVEVVTTLRVAAEERHVEVTTCFVNPSRDHRLRVHLPLPEPASSSRAECAFTIVERGLEAEGRPDEFGLPTYPSRRFVQAGGLTVVHEGLHEYELTDLVEGRATSLALTLLRSTGMLSRLGMSYRPFPAGPLTPVEGLQLVGHRVESRYVLSIDEVDPFTMIDDVFLPLEVVPSLGGGARTAVGSAFEVFGARVSSLRRHDGLLELRVFNPSDVVAEVSLPGRQGWLIDLRGKPLQAFEDTVTLAPQEFATLRLTEPS
jgi:alpha-mannosidase